MRDVPTHKTGLILEYMFLMNIRLLEKAIFHTHFVSSIHFDLYVIYLKK